MEKFCMCNSEWEGQPDRDLRICDLQQVNCTRDMMEVKDEMSLCCEECGYFLGMTSTTRIKCLTYGE